MIKSLTLSILIPPPLLSSEISKAKVIDMTGREQRVLQGYSALRAKKTEEPNDADFTSGGLKTDKFQLEKLCYNLDTLVDHCEHVSFPCSWMITSPSCTIFITLNLLTTGNHSKCQGAVIQSRTNISHGGPS